ncbi:hypothetical protein Kuja_1620 [Vibrio phage vB_VchM_Kuja]|uniref:Uncharacterized protein n=1 Tax=Vibrio phage vB_VchM_Kuja TaxID=2686437 RepID=A0A6B9J9B2_9CAUD|nr:hypothetical protein HWC83_gp074 [Vibrio phage vB_VchM_Kuja]QGZ16153.1 hypothetical protein Kuja_1620 [Vibrio phage vB_VchM_Kuja]
MLDLKELVAKMCAEGGTGATVTERWIIAVDFNGKISIMGLPQVEYDVTYDVEEMGFQEDIDFPMGVFSVAVRPEWRASDREMPHILDNVERHIDEDDVIILWQPDKD